MNEKFIKLIKLACIVYLTIFLPKIVYKNDDIKQKRAITKKLSSLENLIENKNKFNWVRRLNIGFICDPYFDIPSSNFDAINFLTKNSFKLKKMLVPTNKENIKNQISNLNKISKKSELIYLENSKNFIPKSFFTGLDAILFNIRTLGVSNDLCFDILFKTMSRMISSNKKLIILDKPNPLGRYVEGTGRIPLRTGLSVGELALYMNKYMFSKRINLTVIPMSGVKKNEKLHVNFCSLSSFLNPLNKISPINKGINKALCNNTILLPQENALSTWEINYLKKICTKLGLLCSEYSYVNKKNKSKHKGIKIKLKNQVDNFSSFNTLLTLSRFLNNRKNVKLNFLDSFNKTMGSSDLQSFLKNDISFKQLKRKTEKNLKSFCSKANSCLLYDSDLKIKKMELVRA